MSVSNSMAVHLIVVKTFVSQPKMSTGNLHIVDSGFLEQLMTTTFQLNLPHTLNAKIPISGIIQWLPLLVGGTSLLPQSQLSAMLPTLCPTSLLFNIVYYKKWSKHVLLTQRLLSCSKMFSAVWQMMFLRLLMPPYSLESSPQVSNIITPLQKKSNLDPCVLENYRSILNLPFLEKNS